jgi:hypothetical protein
MHYPYQIGGKDDDPNDAVDLVHSIKNRDIIVMGSDGLFYNYDIYESEVIGSGAGSLFYGLRESPQILAEKFARIAKPHGASTNWCYAPSSIFAKRFGDNRLKRKKKDVSVIISQIRLNAEEDKEKEDE